MSEDPLKCLNLAEENGGSVTVKQLMQLGWSNKRAENILTGLLHNSQAWLDVAPSGEKIYWFPSVYNSA